ncbi:hypothetical protein DNTS_009207 [Danionella cerebrum]|uniref:Uncharacterized protein n=1 Tax=Danionella cerebrum TaxID=2873325 RepID=A0A553MMT2_9TELE|nr:hypothetical protein DNTS_009207 [Danionella translucida]TRY54493.1 hypothetical protein DNTS_009207 [Danionella translucida]
MAIDLLFPPETKKSNQPVHPKHAFQTHNNDSSPCSDITFINEQGKSLEAFTIKCVSKMQLGTVKTQISSKKPEKPIFN